MLSLDIIEEVTEPTDWCAPMVLVLKHNKDEVRVCVDLKHLNNGVKQEPYMLPTIDNVKPKLAGAKFFFFTLDASSGCWMPKTNHLYNTNGQILLQKTFVWHHFST